MLKKFKKNCRPRDQYFRRGAVHDRKIKKSYTVRKCLFCEQNFQSEGIHNRLCTPCKSTGYWQTGNDYSLAK